MPHRPPPANSPLPPSGLTLAPPSPARPPSRPALAPPSVIKPRLCFAALQVQPDSRNAAAWSDPHLLKRRWPPPSSEAQASSRTRHSTCLFDFPYPAQAIAYASLSLSSGQGTSQQAREAGDHAPPSLSGCCLGLGRAGEVTRRPLPGSHPAPPWPVASSSACVSLAPKLLRLGLRRAGCGVDSKPLTRRPAFRWSEASGERSRAAFRSLTSARQPTALTASALPLRVSV